MAVVAMRCNFPGAVLQKKAAFLEEVFHGGVSLPI
jgi:hypothetical protein